MYVNFVRMHFFNNINLLKFFRFCLVLVLIFVSIYSVRHIHLSSSISCKVDSGLYFYSPASGSLWSFIVSYLNIVFFICMLCCYIFVLKQNNPLYVLFALIVIVLFVVFCFFIYGFELLSLLFLIIYIGAIAILFLFIIMLFDLKRASNYDWPYMYIYFMRVLYLFSRMRFNHFIVVSESFFLF